MWLEPIRDDLRHACRSIARMPVLSAVVIVSLAVGIGINTVVFSWVEARLWRPLPGVPGSRHVLNLDVEDHGGTSVGASWLDYRDLAEGLPTFESLLAFRMLPLYVGETGRVERVYGMLVSGNYFQALAVRPAVGRLIGPGDVTQPGGAPVAVISHALWQTYFSGRADGVGARLRVNGTTVTVVGVTPADFQGTVPALAFEVYLPATLAPVLVAGSRELEDRAMRGYELMGRLAPRTTLAQARANVDAALRELARVHPATNGTLVGRVAPFSQSARGPQRMMTNAIAILQGIMILLILTICGNAANLMLARASARQREIGVRLALGASPWRVARLLIAENVVLGLIGAVLGTALALWGTSALRIVPLSGFPLRFEPTVSLTGLGFSVALGVMSGVLIGAGAALALVRINAMTAVRVGTQAATRSRVRDVLMGVQVALAMAVLIVAGLFLRSVIESQRADPGFRREGVLLAAYDQGWRRPSPASVRAFLDALLTRLRATPGIEAAAVASSVPLDIHGLPVRAFAMEGRPRADGRLERASTNIVSPGYFALMGIAVRDGRDFSPLGDAAAGPEVIVNQPFVSRYLADVEPLGRRVVSGGRTFTIVGVVAGSTSNAFGEPPTPVLYLSYRDNPLNLGEIHLRTRPGREAALGSPVRRVVTELDAEVPVFNVRTLDDHVETNLVFRRVPARMFVVLGPMLLGLASIGIYAVVAYNVALRTRDTGVRLALGATVPRVRRELMGENLRVVILGASLGWLVAFVGVADLLDKRAIDWLVFLGVPALLIAIAALACWLPARRAAAVDPTHALRQE